MGSAFYAEPLGWQIPEGLVMVSLTDPDLVCHPRRPRCELVHPHPMTECGEFDASLDAPGYGFGV